MCARALVPKAGGARFKHPVVPPPPPEQTDPLNTRTDNMGVVGKQEVSETTAPASKKPEAKKRKKQRVVEKDPAEVLTYLSQWKNNRAGWKFNKNTQSWLIRHMYHADKLNKTGFEWMTEYLQHGPESLRQRVLQDAARRAMRYQQYTDQNDNSEGKNEKATTTDDHGDDQLFQNLSDHDKRKEYKRARKVLEIVAVPIEKAQSP